MMRKIFQAAMVIACLTFLIGCTQGVSKEEYDRVSNELSQVTSQLNQTKQELEKTQKELAATKEALGELQDTTQPLEPKIQLALLLFENIRDYNLWQAGTILQSEFYIRTTDVWPRIENTLNAIGDEKLKQKFTSAWFAPQGKDYNRFWGEIYDTYFIPWFTEIYDKLKQLDTVESG